MASLLANSEYIATVNSKLILCKAIKMTVLGQENK